MKKVKTVEELAKGEFMGLPYSGGAGSSGGPTRSSSQQGVLGSGPTGYIQPNYLKQLTMNWLSQMNSNPPAYTGSPTKQSAFSLPNAYDAGMGFLNTGMRESLMGKNIRRDYRMDEQSLDNAQEDLRKRKILHTEHLANRGMMGKTREGQSATDWMFETRQKQIDLGRVRTYEAKKRFKRTRLHRLLFG